MGTTIVWFRNDLRVQDNRTLTAALQRGGPVIPLFIWAPEEDDAWHPGSATRWWLRRSLMALDEDLTRRRSKLIIRSGQSCDVLKSLIRETDADAIYFSRQYERHALERDRAITIELQQAGIAVETFQASLLIEPWEISNSSGSPFRVFTPYWSRAVQQLETAAIDPVEGPATIGDARRLLDSISPDILDLDLDSHRISQFESSWKPGAASAQAKLKTFLNDSIHDYATDRDKLDLEATSCMSPHLHFGEISPRQIWHALKLRVRKSNDAELTKACNAYFRQLGWREFAYHLMYYFPKATHKSLQTKFDSFPWCQDERTLKSWQEGRTGYPIVDAGMRQLFQTGWINNRLRMIVASFLVKDLLLPWQEGARWFWESLVDADLANNTLNWQWVAGCGTDAAPFFRIFNPVSQGEKFDPEGEYIRRWLPELEGLPRKFIHKPWMASRTELESAGVTLGTTYPHPIVDHDTARRRALDAFRAICARGSCTNCSSG